MEFLYVGARTELDRRIVGEAGLPFVGLPVAGVRGMNPLVAARHLAGHGAILPRALAIVRSFRPHVVLIAGGYVCVPVAIAARLLRLPTVVMTVDIVPGWAIALACRLGSVVTAAFPEALNHLPRPLGGGDIVVAGYPLRADFAAVERASARAALGLTAAEPVLVVFGGSQGARHINTALQESLPTLLARMRVIHVGGRRDEIVLEERRRALPAAFQDRYALHPYLAGPEMARALAAADLALCRSGAGAMAELTAVGLPAVLVPGEFSHQDLNARHMASAGAARVVPDAALEAPAAEADRVEDPAFEPL
ncbi:MAG: UDP-N-acetylglucosamine--N-acetylmuramyl-(pentapeptide) pyrophosphoryl-undecaprenol N-acetylglucosamine transferase [Chloroflexota bacterium]